MSVNQKLLAEIVGLYEKHGWRLGRPLRTPETRNGLDLSIVGDEAAVAESDIDAIWFSRGSQNQREAWELRLLAEQPYALFETLETDEDEEQREERRQEMEASMRERAGGQKSKV